MKKDLRKLLVEFFVILGISWIVEFLYMGFRGVAEGTMLSFLEISLSFDNAVMNALVLSTMTPKWRKRFLTWGMLIAVFGMRFLFPVLIVSLTSNISFRDTLSLAFEHPDVYGKALEHSRPLILAFGGSFLLMVFIDWLFDAGKELHWIKIFEEKASKIAKLGEVKLIVALFVIFLIGILRNDEGITLSMVLGVLLFEIVHFVKNAVEYFKDKDIFSGDSGWASFLYLELLDASCSLDGTVGAFAITQNLIIITVGLSVGAFILRSLTVYFVNSGKLKTLPYLEHGAHWGIGGLGLLMLFELFFEIPEVVISSLALVFIVSSFYSSLKRGEKIVEKIG
ncbi:DUF475 domain-containing protein [Desulfurobacterium atlanticum]|uniref:Integral membrane protein, YkoY family n=1 Tax=Desulfurobacterium atlanticum TaxID=240169 RepID=A0A239A8U5_9BACT|nr:DUF475 domain-containing protein [Desulfurobacterium atlanticum]SNR91751.1 hypothetical protein SAMN06265340_11627 [Desulfurobacterium atlanticum]